MSLRIFAISALVATAQLVSAAGAGKQQPIVSPVLGTDTLHGCYNSTGDLVLSSTDQYNTQGLCSRVCREALKSVGASYATECWCGDQYPALNTLTDPGQCNEPCPGFGDHACGGIGTWTVYNTGYRVSVKDADPAKPSGTSTSATTAAVSTGSSSASASASASSTPQSSGGSNTVGIAVGVVVGILAIAGIAGGAFFFIRRRRNSEIEEEHRRNAAVNAFINGGKAPSSSGSLSINDQRLDPVMATRRASSGSIDDNQDYSRRILRVTNA